MSDMKRGAFVAVPHWSDLSSRRAVYRDSNGEYIRLFTGGIFRKNDNIAGHHGVVVDVLSDRNRVVRFDNGKTATVNTEILTHLQWDINKMCWA